MMKKIGVLFCLSIICVNANAFEWKTLAPGMEYTKILSSRNLWRSDIHVFRFNLKTYRLNLVMAESHDLSSASVQYLARASHALLATNGGFFSPQYLPLGLRINEGRLLNGLQKTYWWGIFYVSRRKAYIVSPRHFRRTRGIDLALQGGPRLIITGRIPTLKPGVADRTAIGITRAGEIILLVTDHYPMTTTKLAELMRRSEKDNGLNCFNALNLDGGTSSQLYAKIGSFSLNVTNFKTITDALIVKRR